MIRRRLATLAVGLVMLAAPSVVSAHSPGGADSTAGGAAPAQAVPLGGQYSPQAWVQIKAQLNSSSLAHEVTVAGGVRTLTYTLPSGSKLVLEEPVGPGVVTPQWSVGGCGFLRVCVWLNRGDQMIVMAGSFTTLGILICAAVPLIECAIVAGALAAAATALQQRGYICSHYMVVELAFSPGTLRGCY